MSLGMCSVTGKVCFDKKGAQSKKNQLLKGGGRRNRKGNSDYLRIYHCEECNYWHLTKSHYEN